MTQSHGFDPGMVVGPSIGGPSSQQLDAATLAHIELRSKLITNGAADDSFRTWIAAATPMPGPRGEDDDLPSRPALHIALVDEHPNAAWTAAVIGALPNQIQGFDVHYIESAKGN
jgi:hypothetical protein